MAQISYGTITVTDITDITDVYLQYALAIDSATVTNNYPFSQTGERGWNTTVPTWQSGYQIWIRQVTEKEGTTAEYGTPYLDTAVNQINNDVINLQTKVKKIWSDNTGTHMAGGIDNNDVVENNSSTYGFNSWINTSSLSFNYNTIPLIEIGQLSNSFNGIKLYSPILTNGVITGNRLDATLDTSGLILQKGGIKAGSSRTNNFVYLSSENFADTITGHTAGTVSLDDYTATDWRQLIGTKFGVRADGTLYASNASINGTIISTSGGQIGPWFINSSSISRNSNGTAAGAYNTASNMYFGTEGISLGTTFKVTSAGALTTTNGQIGGWTIDANRIYKYADASGNTTTAANALYYVYIQSAAGSNGVNYAIALRTRNSTEQQADNPVIGSAHVGFGVTWAGAVTARSLSVYDTNNTKRATINTSGLTCYGTDGSTSTAVFGDTIRLGKTSQYFLSIESSEVKFYNGAKSTSTPYGYIWGDTTYAVGMHLTAQKDNYNHAGLDLAGERGEIILAFTKGSSSSYKVGTLTIDQNSWALGHYSYTSSNGRTYGPMLQLSSGQLQLFKTGGGTASDITFKVTASSGDIRTEGDIYLKGHDSAIGDSKDFTDRSNLSVSSGTGKYVASCSLSPGVWICVYEVSFPSNSTGYRYIGLSTSNSSTTSDLRVPAAPNGITKLRTVKIYALSSTTTVYVWCGHNAGSDLTVTPTAVARRLR